MTIYEALFKKLIKIINKFILKWPKGKRVKIKSVSFNCATFSQCIFHKCFEHWLELSWFLQMAFPNNFTCTSWSIYGFRFRLIAYSIRFLYCRAVFWVDLGALLWEAKFGSWVYWYSFIRCFHVFMESSCFFLVYFQGAFCCFELCIHSGPAVLVGAWL